RPSQPQTSPEFKRYGITYERKGVRVPDTIPIDSNDSVEETAPPSHVTVSPSPNDLPIALHK
ncbi:hypothetical protein A2U01_0104813, partial [Trifolium medium]|nr:hypothetical protein [Trifolium medium]